MLSPFWRSRYISLWTKLRIFNSNVKFVLLNGSETWQLTKTIINKLQDFINRRLHYILGVFWPRQISNDDLWQDVGNGNGSATLSGNLLQPPQGSPLSGTLKDLGKEVVEMEHQARIRRYWNVLGASETDRTKPSPLEKDWEVLCSGRSGED